MQTIPEPSFEPNDRRNATSAPIAWRVLVVVSSCSAVVARAAAHQASDTSSAWDLIEA